MISVPLKTHLRDGVLLPQLAALEYAADLRRRRLLGRNGWRLLGIELWLLLRLHLLSRGCCCCCCGHGGGGCRCGTRLGRQGRWQHLRGSRRRSSSSSSSGSGSCGCGCGGHILVRLPDDPTLGHCGHSGNGFNNKSFILGGATDGRNRNRNRS